MTHTPGPWMVDEWDDYPCVKYPVEDFDGWQHWVPQNHYYLNGSVRDDARLIAAAPDLLEACEAVSDWTRGYPLKWQVDHNFVEAIDKIYAAIARAKGEA